MQIDVVETPAAQVESLIREAGGSVSVEAHGIYRVGDTRHIFSDVSRLTGLGWSPSVDEPTIVAEYLAWAAAQPDLRDTFEEAQARMRALGVLRTTSASPSVEDGAP